jgi:hypothetical protein
MLALMFIAGVEICDDEVDYSGMIFITSCIRNNLNG